MLGAHRELFALTSLPADLSHDVGVVILSAGLLHNVGPFRLHMDLARTLARHGIAVLQLDQSGKGESESRTGLSLTESVLLDYDDVMQEFHRLGIKRTILMGFCSGADDATVIALNRDSVSALVLLDGYAPKSAWHYYKRKLPKLLSPSAWRNKFTQVVGGLRGSPGSSQDTEFISIRNWEGEVEMMARYTNILSQGRPILSIFSGGTSYYYSGGQLSEKLNVRAGSAPLEEVHFAETDHTYSIVQHRRMLINTIDAWVRRFLTELNE